MSVSNGLRIGFLNDRYPFLSLEESKALLVVLKEKGLIMQTVCVLNIGGQETLFVNVEKLHEFVKFVPPSFCLVGVLDSIPRILPHKSDLVIKLVALMVDCFEHYHQNSTELIVQPTEDINGSTMIGLCLGYPVVYSFQSDLSLDELIQFEVFAKFKVPEMGVVNLFSFTVPSCLEFEIVPFIDSWHYSLTSKICPSSVIEGISLEKKHRSSMNVAF